MLGNRCHECGMMLEIISGIVVAENRFCSTRCYAEYRNEKAQRPVQTSFGFILASRLPAQNQSCTSPSLDARLHSTE
jgi:hypothetical protein